MTHEKRFIEYKLKSLANEKSAVYDVKIKDSKNVADIFREIYFELDIDIRVNENFVVLSLNRNNEINGYLLLGIGTISACLVDSRLLGNFLFNTLATSFIICHNHPSGNIQFSDADIELTKKLYKMFQLFDIKLLDSIILTYCSYNSYLDSGYSF